MPSSKEVRARQNRQKERIAVALAERRRVQRRRQRIGAVGGVIALVIVVAIGLAIGGSSSGGGKVNVSSPPSAPIATTTSAATPSTVAAKSVKGKPCVGLKSPLPKGAPAFLIAPGPAPTKLQTQDLTVGTGAIVPKGAKITVNYVGVACSTGLIFDSSYSRNQTFDADLSGSIIAGWAQGIPGMRVGGVRLLTIPSDLAYGPTGNPPIAPDEALYFLVSMVKLG